MNKTSESVDFDEM